MERDHFWLAFYDIQSRRRLNKIAKKLSSCMVRVQKSVFLGNLKEDMPEKLYNESKALLEEGDKLMLIPLCKNDIDRILSYDKIIAFSMLQESTVIL